MTAASVQAGLVGEQGSVSSSVACSFWMISHQEAPNLISIRCCLLKKTLCVLVGTRPDGRTRADDTARMLHTGCAIRLQA